MKKILALLVIVGAAIAGAAVVAKRRGEDMGEFAGAWADRAKEVAGTASDSIKDGAGTIKDTAIDLRDEIPAGDRP